MSFLSYLKGKFLTEAALTKGSQRVLQDKKLVPGLADALRDDAASHPQNFPPNSARDFKKAPDQQLANWFLERLDKIEREGYEGTIYAKDGAYNEWIVRRYIAGSHNWEDIIGVMNMNLRDWALLKNREMLQPGHTDIPKFNSVRDVGKYMSTHYHDKLGDIRNAAALAAVKKQSKTAKIVDNDDYKIYTVFNWAGARTVGNGTQWCTANSTNDTNYNNYSSRAMLFQLFPKNPEMVDKTGVVLGGRTKGPEKYQFDAGTPCFHDIADDPADAENIKHKFPYLYTDLVSGLRQHQAELQKSIDDMVADPALNSPVTKVKPYTVTDEIEKLKKLKKYFTDKVRPKEKVIPDNEPETQALPAPAQPQGNPTMENVDKDVAAMLQSLKKYDMLKESVAPVLGMVTLGEKKGGKPEWLENAEKKAEAKEDGPDESESEGGEIDEAVVSEKDEGKHNNGKETGFKAVAKKAAAEYGSKEAGERVAGAVHAKMAKAGKLEEDNTPDPEILEWMKRFAKLG